MTDANGIAEFRSVYPGWYEGSAIHIHAKVRVGGWIADGQYHGGHVSHSAEFFFDERLNDHVARMKPYRDNTTARTPNDQDPDFTGSSLLSVTPVRHGALAGIQLSVDPGGPPAP
jgi:protocatechuate 3,4-dioxygenase beta subunit